MIRGSFGDVKEETRVTTRVENEEEVNIGLQLSKKSTAVLIIDNFVLKGG